MRLGKRQLVTALLFLFAIGLSAQPQAQANDLDKGIPSEPASRAKMALKLAGLVTFVANSCLELKPDHARFKAAIQTLGVSYDDLSKQDVKAEYLGYAARYRDKPKESVSVQTGSSVPQARRLQTFLWMLVRAEQTARSQPKMLRLDAPRAAWALQAAAPTATRVAGTKFPN